MAVFPFIGSVGYSKKLAGSGALEVYPDNSYRYYQTASETHRRLTLVFRRFKRGPKDAIEAFFEANKFNQFDVYDPDGGATQLDIDGNTGTAKHTALFATDEGGQPEITITAATKCTFDIEAPFILLD